MLTNKKIGLLCFGLLCFGLISDGNVVAEQKPVISGEFNMQNHIGQEVSQKSFAGQYRLVFFGFTNCPDICPTTLHTISQVMQQLGDDSSHFVPLFISVDLENDTVEKLAQYVRAFHPAIVGLTGNAEQLQRAAAGFNASYGKSPDTTQTAGNYYHSSYIYLMDRNGKLLDLFSFSITVDVLLSELKKQL